MSRCPEAPPETVPAAGSCESVRDQHAHTHTDTGLINPFHTVGYNVADRPYVAYSEFCKDNIFGQTVLYSL